MAHWTRKLFRRLGPGIITGAADDDPSGIATYTQAGARFGLSTLWVALITLPLMVAVQEMCARIALVTGHGLVSNLRKCYARHWVLALVSLLAIANIINIGADLGMMAASAQLVLPLPFPILLVGFGVISLGLQILIPYERYAGYLKWLTLSVFAYVLVAFFIQINWSSVLKATFFPIPLTSPDYLLMLVALLGTTISPYLYFWQANEEVEEEIQARHISRNGGKHHPAYLLQKDMPRMRLDVGLGMLISNTVFWFVVLTSTHALQNSVSDTLTPAQAALVLEPLAGRFASVLFSLGIIGTGLLAVPILSGTVAYALSELLNLREGLFRSFKQAKGFYTAIILAMLTGLGLNAIGIDPIRALIYAAVCNALIAPPLLFAILRLGNDEKLMGSYRNSPWSNAFGGLAFGALTLAALAWLAITLIRL